MILGAKLAEKKDLELSHSKRDSLGLGTMQSEIEAVRATWAEVVNAELNHGAYMDPSGMQELFLVGARGLRRAHISGL